MQQRNGGTLISYSATADDVAKVRFSMSPLGETVYSFRMLASPERRRQHQPWVDDVLHRLKGLDLRPLRAVIPPTGYVPDFLTPPPTGTPSSFENELEAVRATRLSHFVDELAWMVGDTGTPLAWRRETAPLHRQMLDEPEKALQQITQRLRAYWRVALEPSWHKLHAGLVSDVRSRMRVMENSGRPPSSPRSTSASAGRTTASSYAAATSSRSRSTARASSWCRASSAARRC